MRRVFFYFLLALSVLAVNSCIQPLEEWQKAGTGATLSLAVSCLEPSTKASNEPYEQVGEASYNENKLTHIDWFIFASNNPNAEAVIHQRVSFTGDDKKPNVVDEFLAASVQMQTYKEKIGTGGYVYVIANLPSTFTHVEDGTVDVDDQNAIQGSGGIQYTEDGDTKTALTLGDLQTLPLSTNFNLFELKNNDDYTSAEFVAQDDFVMASEVLPFTLSETASAEVHASLSRLAAKITLEIKVISAVDEVTSIMSGRWKQGERYVKTWYPDVSNIDVYLSYANQKGTLTPVTEATEEQYIMAYNDEDFFTYNRYAFKSSVTPEVTTTTMPDQWKVTGTPFYSYPMKWEVSDSHAPFIKIIIPWRPYTEVPDIVQVSWPNPDNDTESVQGPKVNGATRENWNKRTESPQEFFYKISIPDETRLRSNVWYKLSLDVAILGGTSDDLSTTLAGRYYVINWSTPNVELQGELDQGKYLTTASDVYYIYGGDEIEIPVMSSHDIIVSSTQTRTTGASWTDFYNNGQNDPRTYTGTTGLGALTNQPTITADGRSSILFTHELIDITEASATTKPDVSEYIFKVTIANSVGLSKDITIIQRPALMIKNDQNSEGSSYNSNRHGYVWINGTNTNNYGGIRNSFGTTGGNSNPNMYIVSTSVVPDVDSDLSELIADPRKLTNDLVGVTPVSSYYIGGGNNTRQLQYYYPADVNPNKIAPKFRVSSSWGAVPSPYIDFSTAQRRCATYQEDGIPAGRWRVPTRAEVEFMILLSTVKVIPKLYTEEDPTDYYGDVNYADGGYWCSDGGVVYPWNETNPVTGRTVDYLPADQLSANGAASYNGVRCVYDEWFWGIDDRLPANQRNRFTWGDRQIQ